MPKFFVDGPGSFYAIPEEERATRCAVEEDACIVDRAEFYIRGLVEIHVHGTADPLVWGVWVSLSLASFTQWVDTFKESRRAHVGPFFGWLESKIGIYPETRGLKTSVHLRDEFQRPLIVLKPTDHPLAIEQREGIYVDRLAEIVAFAEQGCPRA